MRLSKAVLTAVVVVVSLVLAGCGDSGGLSQTEVEGIVEDAVADAVAAIPESQPGVSVAEVEEAIRSAVAEIDLRESGLSRDEVEGMVGETVEAAVAAALQSAPASEVPEEDSDVDGEVGTELDPAQYTQTVVSDAIDLYEAEGLDAALAYYNSPESVNGQWYVFVIDEDDEVIGHFDAGRRGLDLKGWVGTDVNGYDFGPVMLSATEDGKWVTYVYKNPATGSIDTDPAGEFELKNAWVVRHDGLLFGSGWYVSGEQFIYSLVADAVDKFRESGLEASVAYFANPDSVVVGLRETVSYYNLTDSVDGKWLGFVAGSDGRILAHNDPQAQGGDIAELLGEAVLEAPEAGRWFTAEDNDPDAGGPEAMRIWVVDYEGTLFGAGWYRP